MDFKKFKHTKRKLTEVGFILKRGLQKELAAQKHNATGRLSRGIKHHIKDFTLSMMSPVTYWKAVNNPKFAKKTNIETIRRWVAVKGLPDSAAYPIFQKLTNNKNTNRRGYYGQPYAYWTEGNDLRRTNFSGYVANKFKAKIVNTLAPAIGKDVAKLIGDSFKTPKSI